MTGRRTAAALFAALPALAALPQGDTESAPEPGVVTIGEQGSEQDPLAGHDRGLAAEPQRDPEVHQVEGILGVPAISVQIDPRVLGVAPGEPLPPLRREGEAVRKRDGQLLPAGDRGYAVFILDADPEQGDPQPLAMVVAPCLTLESMERLMEQRGDGVRFTLTGEVHTYRGVNYLLPTGQPRPWLVADAPDSTLAEQSAEPSPDEAPADPQPEATGTNSQTDPAADAGGTPSADDVLGDLLEQRRENTTPRERSQAPADPATEDIAPLITAPAGQLTDPLLLGLDPDQPQAELINEGEFLIARTGRLVRTGDGSQALFVLDADQADAPEPPMIMHACKLLEHMEATVREQGDDVPFIVTGQVFVYRGANYLLPTIVKREFDRGNLE